MICACNFSLIEWSRVTMSNAATLVQQSSFVQLPSMSSEQQLAGTSAQQSGYVQTTEIPPTKIAAEECVPVVVGS